MIRRTAEIFAAHARQLCSYGLAALPCDGKQPLVSGWNNWTRAPGQRFIERLSKKHPGANIGIVPGLSDLLIVDVDTASHTAEAERLFGPTPFRVRTGRGMHSYYRWKPKDRCAIPGNLRLRGLNVDLKTGRTIVIFPPSLHDSGVRYAFDDGCNLDMLREVPPPRLDQILKSEQVDRKPLVRHDRIPEGFRAVTLNRWLCREAPFCETFDEVMAIARDINADCDPPLTEAELAKRARCLEGRAGRQNCAVDGR